MNSRQAFRTLLAGVDAALEESLARHRAATQQGDFDTMEVELERQKNLVSARQQLEGLQELWPRLVGEHQSARRSKRAKRPASRGKKLPRGAKTPEGAFVLPILHTLEELGGSGAVAEVLDLVGKLMSGTLNEFDLSPLKSGQVRWRNTAQWARQRMRDEGLLAGDSPRGIWEMTERGRAYLREHAEERAALESLSQSGESGLLTIPAEGLPIFARYKGRRFEAILLPDHHVRFGEKEYGSPSGAGLVIVDSKTLNGWRFWHYVDDKGLEHPISDLRG